MIQKLHKNAKTNYAIRQAIKESQESVSVLAARYHLSWATVKKMSEKLVEFVNRYNSEKRLKSLQYNTPAQYLKETKNISIQRIVI